MLPENAGEQQPDGACVVCGGGRTSPLPLSPGGPDCDQDWHTASVPSMDPEPSTDRPTAGQLIEDGISHYMAKVGLPQIRAGIQATMPTAASVAAMVGPMVQAALQPQIDELGRSIGERLTRFETGAGQPAPAHETYGSGLGEAEALLIGAGATPPRPGTAIAMQPTPAGASPGEQVLAVVNGLLEWAAEDPQRAASVWTTFRGGQTPQNKTGLQLANEVWSKFPDEAQYVAEGHMPGVYAVAGTAGEKGYQEGFAARGRMENWRTQGAGGAAVSPVAPRSEPTSNTRGAPPAHSMPTRSPAPSSPAPSAPLASASRPIAAASSGRADFTRGLIGG